MIDDDEMLSYRVNLLIGNKWIDSRLRFPYADEAQMCAFNYFAKHREVKDSRIAPSPDNITSRWAHGRIESVKPGDVA